MASTFFERISYLSHEVGHGTLRAKVEVNQVYAHYQHEGTEFAHPRGGQAHYLRNGLYEPLDAHMGKLALRAITPEGSELKSAMRDVAEDIADEVFDRAPREFQNLRNSGHPSVLDDGSVIYDRPPHVPRLTDEQLRSEHTRRRSGRRGLRRRHRHLTRRGVL